MYTARTQEEILAEMLAESTLPSSKIEGTFEYDVLASNAVEFNKTEVEMAEMHRSAFGMTAWDEYLDYKAEGHGVVRRQAVKAVGTVTVTGNGTVEQGSYFQTEQGVRFIALETVKVIETAKINIEAVDAGASGNVAAGAIAVIPMSIAGIVSVTNEEATHDGYDREDDDTYRARYLKHVRLPAVSGNPYQYEDWALEVEGVGAARCIRNWNGPNSVKLIIVNSNMETASDYLIQQVYDHIQEKRAIGAMLTVVSAKPKIINIDATVIGTLNETDFYQGVAEYFKKITNKILSGGKNSRRNYYISYAQISSIILVEGEADDHINLLINGGTENITLEDDELPVLGTVTFR